MKYTTKFAGKEYYVEIKDTAQGREVDHNLKKLGKGSAANNIFVDGALSTMVALFPMRQEVGDGVLHTIISNSVFNFPELWGVKKDE